MTRRRAHTADSGPGAEQARGMTTTLEIARIGRRGEGLAPGSDRPIAVPFTLPGEKVEVELTGKRALPRRVLEASPNRIEPFCPHFGRCGGCSLQHMTAAAYGAFKRGLVAAAVERAGIAAPVGGPVLAHGNGRRRAALHVRRDGAGYMRARTHDLAPIETCPILVPALREAPVIASAAYPALGECEARFTATEAGIDLALVGGRRARPEALIAFARRFDLARLSHDGEPVVQMRPATVRMGRAEVELPPGSFLQATEAAEVALADLAVEALVGRRRIVDLFSGLGPFALRLAETARILALDSDEGALDALGKAARRTPGLKPVETRRRDLMAEPLSRFELEGFDAALFDPPRVGAEAQAREIAAAAGLETVVAVSCDPQSFARDAAILIAGGLSLERVTPVDQFAWSAHIELVGVFRR